MKRILLLSTTTGYQADAFRRAALDQGVEVILGTDRCHNLDDPWRDGAIALRFHQPEKAAAILADHAFDGVVAIGDAPVVTAALACQQRGIPFHPPSGARACRDKLHSRTLLQVAGLRVPYFAEVFSDDAPHGTPFPCVLKPAGMSASRGVIRADNPGEFQTAYKRIAALDPAKPILVEGFIPGQEFAIEGIMERGHLHVLAIFDKPDPLDGPFFEETIYVTPSRLPEQEPLIEAVRGAVAALGLYHGPIHAEARCNDRGAWILEVAARPIGGLCARALRFDAGETLESLIVRHALGESVADARREPTASGVMMIPIPKAGLYSGVEGVEAARAVPGVAAIEITAKPGQRLVPLPEGASYLGFIFASATQPGEVEQSLRAAHAKLRFAIAPALPVLA